MESEDGHMSVDTRRLTDEELAEVDRILAYLNNWMDARDLCRQHGVQEVGQIPLPLLRVTHAQYKEDCLRFRGRQSFNNVYARADRQEELEPNKPAYMRAAPLYLGPEDNDH